MADPAGKESQFTVKVNGVPVPISSVTLKDGDPYSIVVNLVTPLTGSETVLISYTQGDVTSEAGGLLPSFVDQPVSFLVQTITFAELPLMTWGDPAITLSASASSGAPSPSQVPIHLSPLSAEQRLRQTPPERQKLQPTREVTAPMLRQDTSGP
jgi:hypothetical protein